MRATDVYVNPTVAPRITVGARTLRVVRLIHVSCQLSWESMYTTVPTKSDVSW